MCECDKQLTEKLTEKLKEMYPEGEKHNTYFPDYCLVLSTPSRWVGRMRVEASVSLPLRKNPDFRKLKKIKQSMFLLTVLFAESAAMAQPRVYHQKKMFPGENDNELVFVGRPSKWGNPYSIGPHGSRNQVIAKYRKYLEGRQDLQEAAKVELRGKDLLCFCHPLPCHADILLEIANSG